MAKQEKDGSWKSGRTGYEPPIGDNSDVLTMQAVLVLAAADKKGLVGDGWTDSRDRSPGLAEEEQARRQPSGPSLQTQLAQPFGKPEEVGRWSSGSSNSKTPMAVEPAQGSPQ